MPNRQKLYISLGVSIGICTGITLYLLYRHRPRNTLPKSSNSVTSKLILSPINSCHEFSHTDMNLSPDVDNDETECKIFPNELQIPDGNVPLTPDQASILTRFLCDSNDNEEQLHYILTNIANASMFKESQINLANAGCITCLRELLLKTDNQTTKRKILLALNNLALNDFAITQFSNIVAIVINLCRTNLPTSQIRLDGLTLLINMSVLQYLHEEYMSSIYELGLLIESTIKYDDEALSAGKILVNLSTNKTNLESLLKITGVELKLIMNLFTSKSDQSSRSEDILVRFLSFYCNIANIIIDDLKNDEDSNNNNNSWICNPKPHRQNALYFELFDRDKQALAKSLLRPQYTSTKINYLMKRLYQSIEKIRQSQSQI